MFKVGRICVKNAGREIGRKCVVVDTIDKNYVLITGPKNVSRVKRRRANVKQLEPTDVLLSIEKGISDEELENIIKKENKLDFMKETIKIK
ncbi:MAG: 50S ribosomal protein L14e [Candidatus Helarchaeota archaeon]